MNHIVLERIKDAKCTSLEEEISLIKEMVQEISLLGLWRAKFYEKASFYGGTALRILHGLPRFSEDLDFSLLAPDLGFSLMKYESAIQKELESFGFTVSFERKLKKKESTVESAFIKANTLIHLIEIHSKYKVHKDALFKVKLEVDLDPPLDFESAVNSVFWPIPFSVKSFSLPDLFAGKMHACICRSQRINIKGRDWYDFLWYIGRKVPLHLKHLETRMIQSGHLEPKTMLSLKLLKKIFEEKVSEINFNKAKQDVLPFIKNAQDLDAWSTNLFKEAWAHLKIS